MLSNWTDFLLSQNATLADGAVSHFGDSAAEIKASVDKTILADLSFRLALDGRQTFPRGHSAALTLLAIQP